MKYAILSVSSLFLAASAFAFGPSSLPDTGDWAGIFSWVLYALVVMIGLVVLGKLTNKAIKRHRSKHTKK